MAENYKVKIDGGVVTFECATLKNAGILVEVIGAQVPDAAVELTLPDGSTLANPSRQQALAFLAAKGYTVLAKGIRVAPVEPEQVAPLRAVTVRTTARKPRATTATRATGERKKVAAARK